MFMKFNERTAVNLQRLITETQADIILTTTHRNTYSIDVWNANKNSCNSNFIGRLFPLRQRFAKEGKRIGGWPCCHYGVPLWP